jgi:hypothetical protein
MAIINIPSSWSPIAAGIDVLVQDRLARQKRERQAEQDAWNLEARNRQRQGWARQDQMHDRADILWQRQQDAYNKQQAKLAALGDATWQDRQIYNTGGYESPEYDKYRGAMGRSVLGGQEENVPTVAPEQMQMASAFERAMASKRMANTHGIAPMTAGKIHGGQPQDIVQLTDQQIAEAIAALKDPQVSRTMKVYIAKQLAANDITPTIINQVWGPEAAKTVHEAMSVSDPDYMAVASALHDPNATYVAESGQGVGYENIEEAGGEQADYSGSRTPQQYTPEDRLALHQRFYGKPATPSQSAAYYKGQRAEKPAETVPFTHWQKAFGHSGGQVQTGDVMSGIEAVMKEALMDNLKSSDHYREYGVITRDEEGNPTQIQPPNMSELFSAVQEEELMSNMWQAAQMIQRQYFPMKTPQMVFQEMKRAIGTGPKELDLINTTGTMAGYEPTGNYLSRYLHTPKIYNAQQIMQDYLKVLEIPGMKETNV